MNKFFKLIKYIFNSDYRFIVNAARGKYNRWGDREYLERKYKAIFHKKLDLDNPQTFNEKLQWLKLYDRRPEYTTMVDKYAAKKYVADRIGEEHIIPTLGVWDKFDDIDFDALPNQFVLKCTHDSGGLVIVKDKATFDRKAAKKKIEKSLKTDYYLSGREWPYKNVPRRIIAEKYMVDESGYELKDYKFFAFDGFAKAMYIATDRQTKGAETKCDYYDMEFNHLPFENGHPNATKEIKRPQAFNEMKELAGKLSKGFPEVRVDFYDINGQVYFGELTLFHWSGMAPFKPEEWDRKFGEWIELDPKNRGGGYFVANKGYILYIHFNNETESSLNAKSDSGLIDYKLMCFGGEVYCTLVATDRFSKDGLKITFYDKEWKRLPFKRPAHESVDADISCPDTYKKMLEAAEILSKNIPFVRTDFYEIDGKLYFGELTFYPGSGFEKFDPEEWDLKLGKLVKLPQNAGGGTS